jgi:hypothetical protein
MSIGAVDVAMMRAAPSMDRVCNEIDIGIRQRNQGLQHQRAPPFGGKSNE